jgi:hypothetical protein
LKREFKIYSYLQDRFIELTAKKKKFPLRVPLCFFFEYLGYSGLLKYLPYLKTITEQEEQSRAINYLRKVVEEEHIDNYYCSIIANRLTPMYMITVKHPYKITKPGKDLELSVHELYGPKFI